MSEYLRREQDEINAANHQLARATRRELARLLGEAMVRIKELETSLEHVLARLHALEEKERQRAREAYAIELNLDRETNHRYDTMGC